jgi:hypothetical protein
VSKITIIGINEAKDCPKRQKERKEIIGNFNNIVLMKINKKITNAFI